MNGGNGVFFLGIDGGGTKTAFLLINENGDIIEAKTIATVSYKHVGMDNSIALLKETVHEILNDREAYICLALPNWGESKDGDGEFLSRIKEITELPVKIVNDSVVGWAGSLGLSSGINLVAGTGSIAYGRNDAGEEARAGGWDERFSDEGSCYWLGMKSLELFSKESDGRAEKGALLEIFRNRFELKCDFDIIDIFNRRYRNDRTKIAGLQKYLLEAAQKGDLEAVKMYEIAVDELAMIVGSVYRKLKFGEGTLVSYSGGLFHAGEFILGPLRERLKTEGVRLCAPKYTPVEGASLLAAEMFDGEKQYIEAIRRGFDIK